ncbi:hypothetical protein BG011_001575 [Mortierella polycephala]|uniref:Uncharacterized protein n=1 Tax=Mortierella polycephala TaxID=41804 RepID=A0A9P6Q774_9FUNG|nr:hypothetical protein BG011_001575 [Mortierella polycephala]
MGMLTYEMKTKPLKPAVLTAKATLYQLWRPMGNSQTNVEMETMTRAMRRSNSISILVWTQIEMGRGAARGHFRSDDDEERWVMGQDKTLVFKNP